MSAGIFSLVDRRGRKYLTGEERARFLRAVREDPRPAVRGAMALSDPRRQEIDRAGRYE